MFVVLVTALTGCLASEQQVTVADDGSGTMVLDLVISPELVAVLSAFGEEVTSEALIADIEQQGTAGLPDGIDVEFSELDGVDGVGVRASLGFTNLDQLNELLGSSGADESVAATFTGSVQRTGDRFEFRAEPVPEEDLASDFGFGFGASSGDLPEPSAAFSLKLPGSVVETNGTEDDGFVTWDLLGDDVPDELVLVTEPGGAGVPWLLVAGGLLALAGIAGIAVLALRRRGSTDPGHAVPPPVPGPDLGPWPVNSPVPPAPQAPAAPQHDPAAWAPQAPAAPQAPVPPGDTGQPAVTQPLADENLPPAGWYPDPQDPSRTRWWTGRQWAV
jgi:hypothetical protein